jgi:endonuclease VIII-like 1
MPELAEIKIMAEYINSVCGNKQFKNIEKSSVTKVKCDVNRPFDNKRFTISASSRGKELMLTLRSESGETRKLLFAMGMSGHWAMVKRGQYPVHAHLIFISDEYCLAMVDVRRFAKWKWNNDWNKKRGPCPVNQYDDFVNHFFKNRSTKIFQKPVFEALMDQSYFNGIGNYLRAEILFRLDINPLMKLQDALGYKNNMLLRLCHDVCQEAYLVGGGELKDWTNPFKTGYARGRINKKMKVLADTDFRDWLKCYGKALSIIDAKGRRFWYSEKWKSQMSDI